MIFLRSGKQRVVLNGEVSACTNVNAGVPQGSILGPLFFAFLIYINDLAGELSSNTKLFADDTSLFSVVHNKDSSAAELNSDLAKISHSVQHWKMSFNPDPSEQAHEVIFSRKVKKDSHHPLTFSNSIVYQATSQKHLSTILDNRLSFEEHLRLVFSKMNRTIGLLRKLQCLIPRFAPLTIYRTFGGPLHNYGDIYAKAFNSSFHQKVGSSQYNACLAITGAIRGTSKEKLNDELGLESLHLRRWFRKLCCFYKFYKHESLQYLL